MMPNGHSFETSHEERQWAMACHLGALAFILGGPMLLHIVVPLIIWVIKKDQYPFVDDQGKESLNFQISVTLAGLVCVPLMFVLIGFLLIAALGVYALVMVITAGLKARDGVAYRYPITLRLIK